MAFVQIHAPMSQTWGPAYSKIRSRRGITTLVALFVEIVHYLEASSPSAPHARHEQWLVQAESLPEEAQKWRIVSSKHFESSYYFTTIQEVAEVDSMRNQFFSLDRIKYTEWAVGCFLEESLDKHSDNCILSLQYSKVLMTSSWISNWIDKYFNASPRRELQNSKSPDLLDVSPWNFMYATSSYWAV